MKLYEVADTNYMVVEDVKSRTYILKDGRDFYQLDYKKLDEIVGYKSRM